ncbi:MAG: hypothetical protein A3H70_01905 [Candidatus Komeilibacteria bacterium RIFCSPLOWO2_02_FULL_48_11]|uniref:NAD-dependent epimerase/dehydratase domain-containing protein n=1 Tax=Candidatus Komeilibacteria bacterium RIFCSPLOWO2_02_FULL_48_11 TaxID=1798553 RepID=A0A1G2BSQ4_9BACT|nr:MAG: hypothetical protein A3H70_01905 [Candidatus Komeilibacteria bacterium RIFCSPLOWO2_02_FULL_48_11]
MPKVLITGGAGCIGQAIAQYFKRKNFAVVTYDIIEPKEVFGQHVMGTIMYTDELYQAMLGCDYVIHLAAMLGVARTEANRMECLNININGTKNVFDASVYAGIKKIIFASSSEVYGEPEKNPIVETDPVRPKSVYAVSKLAGEEYARAYKQQFNLDYSIIRFFNVYGPDQVGEFVIPRFVRSVLRGQSPTVYGNGEQTRCYCHVDDGAQGVYLALMNEAANGEVFNIGNDKTAISVKALAEKIIALSGKKLELKFVALEDSDRSKEREIYQRTASIAKASQVLGYQPVIGLEEGIKDVINKDSIKDGWSDEKDKYHSA